MSRCHPGIMFDKLPCDGEKCEHCIRKDDGNLYCQFYHDFDGHDYKVGSISCPTKMR